ncbi:DUF2442 domain-containing protein [Pseudomonas sp. SWRI154]|uniref:DUF2442 domain-containing protein n=1 Tax=Pseudomonas sp. SWRI154 TaxID=2745501 RepID=UPI0016478FB2|nr:DUF2442 domain-containing protein [Pseudomonas sp. SWRI154]MBC3364624.1 DUF2442 domain-containing protein [Pseudomonas sp. SWRI154]
MISKARINSVKSVPGKHALQVEFANGKHYDVDLREHIRQYPVLKPLEDLSLFGTAQVGEWGFDVSWGDGLELAAVTLHRLALEQAGEVMPTQAFKRWMANNQLSLTTAAQELGFTRRTITAYSSGTSLIPKHVALACKGWEFEHKGKRAIKAAARKTSQIA